VAEKCYRAARKAAMTDDERAHDGLARLPQLLADPRRVVRRSPSTPTPLKRRTLAIEYRQGKRLKYGLLNGALTNLLGGKKARLIFTTSLAKAGLTGTGQGHAGTVQRRLPVRVNGKTIRRPRLWVVDARKLSRLSSKRVGGRPSL
jgi:hypothetical protein